MIRILHSVSNMDRAGIETMLMNYYRYMDKSKVQFDFLCNKKKPGAYDDEIKSMGGRIYHTPGLNPAKYPVYLKYMRELFQEHEPVPYSAANICSAVGPHDPFSEEQLGGCTGPGICALSVGRAGGRFAKQHFQCHPCPAGTGSCTADRTANQWLFQTEPDISRRSPDCAEMHNRDGQK